MTLTYGNKFVALPLCITKQFQTMKTLSIFNTNILVIALLIIGSTAFGSSKKTTKKTGGTVFGNFPCQKEGRSDRTNFRAYADAESQNISLARAKALTMAKSKLAEIVNTTVNTAIDNYINEKKITDKVEFESLTREVVNKQLDNVEITCEEQSITKEGTYKKFIAIQIDKDDLLRSVESQIFKNQKLQIGYDKMKFKEIFDAEMDTLAADQPF